MTPEQQKSESGADAAPREKILVIEDEMALLSVMSVKLKNEGFEVFLAQSGQEGLKLAKEKNPDVILLDIIMPEMNGYMVLEELKKDAATSPIPVIILSNSGQEEEIKKGRELGAIDYLIKSQLSLDEMAKTARQYIRK